MKLESAEPNAITVFNIIDLLAKNLQQKDAPEAYMMYALYDSDSVMYKTGKQVLTKNAANRHEVLKEDLYISEDGYMEAFVVNETEEDVWFDDFSIQSTSPFIVQETHYDPWGLELTGLGFQAGGGVKVNRYLYNGKEIQIDHNLELYDYGARFYDPVIGRWSVVDPLADISPGKTPYHFVSNNPLNRIDPDGLTDFTVNKKTGEINQVGEANDDPDRILKTNRKGEVKHKKSGEAKVAIDDISKGILEDGMNLEENDVTFEVNGKGQPTLEEFNRFISEFSDYVGKEIAGIRLGNADSEQVLKVKTHKYKFSTKVKSQTPMSWLTRYGDYLKGHFHTHPYHDHTPSEKDKLLKTQYSDILLYIIAGGHEKKF